ncbi:hypothetical protein NDS46_13985 [Paenibacillus thiaminolyticus]|uniref:hypothetical protein n=1 Tax=Paenibacillus thiaminolyticus TaxID=49283 RepID=UPI00232BC7C0|nr:hypothetical protein [Paenibacillus thiaminolyticus]WCF10881.1 hypothetical protein NDS46_13985 [Paenibacillus thiaminolyticus]
MLLTARLAKKTAKLQFPLVKFPPLKEFLQNSSNFSYANGLKAKISEIDVLLQEWHEIAAEIA